MRTLRVFKKNSVCVFNPLHCNPNRHQMEVLQSPLSLDVYRTDITNKPVSGACRGVFFVSAIAPKLSPRIPILLFSLN